MNNTEYNIKCFKKEKSNYELKYKEYVDKCDTEKKKNGVNTVILTTEEIELINSLRLTILYWIALFDNITISKLADKKFISGIRYINNIFKHSKKQFEISEISRAGINLEVKIDDTDGIEITDVSITPAMVFGDMDLIPIDVSLSEKEKQRIIRQQNNYKAKIKGKKTLDILKQMEVLLEMYYKVYNDV